MARLGRLLAALLICAVPPRLCAENPDTDSTDGSRIVHHFHFNERDEGNLEDLPRYWEPLRLAGFPRFAEGAFDFAVGHSTPASFHLASNGRNVAFQYTGPETRVREDTDYRIVAHVRPDRLDTARACLSAFYLDRARRPILNSLVRSRWIGDPGENSDWVRVELFLPPAPADAHTIGLTAWVMQEATWNTRYSAQRNLSIVNVNAGIWLDDIVVYALPLVSLITSNSANIMESGKNAELHVVLADQHDQGLVGDLNIVDAAGRNLDERVIPATAESPAPPTIIDLNTFSPGLYLATLRIRAQDRIIVTRTLRFAILAPTLRFADSGTRAVGVSIDPAQRSHPDTEDRLVRRCGVQSLKLPVWSGLADDAPPLEAKAAQDRWLQFLLKDGFLLTGVLAGVPADLLRGKNPYSRSLLDLLTEHASLWEPSLGAVVAPYASTFRAWQFGPDDWSAPLGNERLVKSIEQLTSSMRRYVTAPYLIAPVSTDYEARAPEPHFDHLVLRLPAQTQPEGVAPLVAHWRAQFPGKLSLSVPALPADSYDPSARLIDWAQRLIAARHTGADTVFVPQPWTVRSSVHGSVAEPQEEYLILRTLTDMLGEALPAQHFMLSPTAHVFVFHTGSDAAIAAWDSAAPAEGVSHVFPLGAANRQVNIFGIPTALERDMKGRQQIRLGPSPVFIDRVDTTLIDMFTSFSLSPQFVESGREVPDVTLAFANRSSRTYSGSLVLRPPQDWDIVPRQFDVNLLPQREEKLSMTIRAAHNAPAGHNVITAELTLSDGTFMEVPLAVELGLSAAHVQGMAWLDGGDLMIRHEVTNRSTATLHFRGSALVPGRERQYRPINNLKAGETQRVEYKFRDCTDLIGSGIRLELRETNDGPRTHTLELRVP